MRFIRLIIRKTLRKPLFPVVSVTGLTAGFVALVFITLWLKDELSFDKFQENAGRIYRLTVEETNAETTKYRPRTASAKYKGYPS